MPGHATGFNPLVLLFLPTVSVVSAYCKHLLHLRYTWHLAILHVLPNADEGRHGARQEIDWEWDC